VRTKRGLTRALLFPKAIQRAEYEANAPLREALELKRERLRAKKAAKTISVGPTSPTPIDLGLTLHCGRIRVFGFDPVMATTGNVMRPSLQAVSALTVVLSR
jgi:hypothetical protein